MSNLGNRSLLEAIAFPIAIENIMRGRLRGYYFNTFLLLAEQCARTLQHARWVAASLPATRELSPGALALLGPWLCRGSRQPRPCPSRSHELRTVLPSCWWLQPAPAPSPCCEQLLPAPLQQHPALRAPACPLLPRPGERSAL